MSPQATGQSDMSMFFQFIDMIQATCSLWPQAAVIMSPKQSL